MDMNGGRDRIDPEGAAIGEGPAWYYNSATGELVRPVATEDRRVVADLWLQPGAAVAGAHSHPNLIERFRVLEGEVSFMVDGKERTVPAGEPRIEVQPGISHDWWNAGEGIANVEVEVIAAPGSNGDSAARFVEMIDVLFSLGTMGKVGKKGVPGPLWLSAIGSEYRDVIRFDSPPAAVQAVLFGPLAWIARLSGRRPDDEMFHGDTAPCRISDVTEEKKRELLSHKAKVESGR